MIYTYVPPLLPTFVRWRKLYSRKKNLSCLRALEYERLDKLHFQGPILDVGGGGKSLYRDLLPADIAYESINIDPAIAPTYLIEPGGEFPVADDSFPTCLCFNTLEHVYDAKFVIGEIHRVLKPGGVAHITVPFIFRIHGHPDDYFRATPSWWRETLQRAGFSEVVLHPLVWGRYTSGANISGYRGILRRLRFHLAHLADLVYARLAFTGSDGCYSGRRGERICATSPGWFISASK
ncbi:methyltransferase domain-containing protein [Aquamicrobium defluvii]|uniref:Methyltransferase family protein n=1 Tax=Aquamicrobium defluvii TaxID=69279 RepID=A0A4R6YC32_9HYPH|nr:methyltransferase domain-containing protein [Aquamicrobium defluvii]TDR33224.1 methyltransferase family protein [Aquamicrobium defluvii]